jgi:hypothetical protein
VLHAYPEAAKCNVSLKGYTLPFIYYAIELGCSDDVLLSILEANKKATEVIENSSKFLLHEVINRNLSSAVIKATLNATINTAEAEVPVDGKKLPMIFHAIEKQCPEDMLLAILDANKSAASANDHNGCFLLQQVIQAKCSSKLILAVLQANKNATMCDIPVIFKALQYECSDDVILALLDANESAVKKYSSSGRLLLHEALIYRYSEKVIMKVFHAYPWAAMIRCKQTGKLPLHFAAESSSSHVIVEALIRKYPEALDTASLQDKYFPRDYITSALPEKSIEMICKPYSEWKKDLSGEDSTGRSVIDNIQQLKSDVTCLFDKFMTIDELHAELKEKFTSIDTDFQQVSDSVRQFTVEIGSLSKHFQSFLKSQINPHQKCDAVEAYKLFANNYHAEWKKVHLEEKSSVVSSIHGLTREVATLSNVCRSFCNTRISAAEEDVAFCQSGREEYVNSDRNQQDDKFSPSLNHTNEHPCLTNNAASQVNEDCLSLASFPSGEPIIINSTFQNNLKRIDDPSVTIEKPKVDIQVHLTEKSYLSDCQSSFSEVSQLSDKSKDNFNSYVFLGTKMRDGMEKFTRSKDISCSVECDESVNYEAVSSVRSDCETTHSFIEVDVSSSEANESILSEANKVSDRNNVSL